MGIGKSIKHTVSQEKTSFQILTLLQEKFDTLIFKRPLEK